MKTVAVIPAYNEANHIADIVQAVLPHVEEVVVIDDGSSDNTSERALAAGATVLTHVINCGAGAATQTGLSYALDNGADYVVTFDGDGQHDPKDIPGMLEFIQKEQKDVVLGSRFLKKNDIPKLRLWANKIANTITFFLSGIAISDSQSGFKVFSRHALPRINITANGFEFCTEIIRTIANENLSYTEYPISVYYSEESMAKGQNFSTGVVTVFKLIVRSLMR
ncbi:MAG: hypothetical protein A2V81_03140 [Candidatus Abawacabacteria bacterium RBG_16_42_10]|uniref:Glycosyltransferase 2-like domain-containing protein n=1 Tax=Candidatus Abawacabacteria bacterium RBG_16_42_10 TaxID=1817814 RepID=A0A1F4XKG8_9BACT|nr:MAG: hypothetical protein A2V81_03140 [Candidatus Abawacabacteria bacterium RBG_16_42_10]